MADFKSFRQVQQIMTIFEIFDLKIGSNAAQPDSCVPNKQVYQLLTNCYPTFGLRCWAVGNQP